MILNLSCKLKGCFLPDSDPSEGLGLLFDGDSALSGFLLNPEIFFKCLILWNVIKLLRALSLNMEETNAQKKMLKTKITKTQKLKCN